MEKFKFLILKIFTTIPFISVIILFVLNKIVIYYQPISLVSRTINEIISNILKLNFFPFSLMSLISSIILFTLLVKKLRIDRKLSTWNYIFLTACVLIFLAFLTLIGFYFLFFANLIKID